MVPRILGEVPNVAKASWDWQSQKAYVRFEPGKMATEADLKNAMDRGTMFTAGDVTYVYELEKLPRELR